MTVPWLLGVARHKLADHYRRRHDRFSIPVAELPEPVDPADDWDAELDRIVAESVLARLPEQHRTVLALRYMDDCSVPECAELIGRTVHATEALLVRARRAFRSSLPGAGRREVMNNSHDPLTVLHGDELPVQPDPAFAARLRARLESAVSLPNRTQGVVMSGTDTAIAELNEPTAEPVASAPPRPAALPYLTVANAREAIAWYVDAFGASVVGEPFEMDDGRIGHAELAIGGGVLYLADEYPEIGLKAPDPQATSVSLMLHVADTDATLERARERGAQVQQEPVRELRLPQRHDRRPVRASLDAQRTGDRRRRPDPARRRRLRLGVDAGRRPRRGVLRPCARVDLRPGDPSGHQHQAAHRDLQRAGPPTLFCCYAVADLAGARQSILDGGGTVDELQQFDFGTVLDATDPPGTAFAVFQPAPGEPRPELNGTGPGELSYITYEVTDSTAFKAFYSRVLFWTFEPGRIDDGWQVQETHPMAGVAGGSAAAGDRADVDRRGRRRRGGPGARGRRHGHRGAVAAGLRQVGAVHRRPGHPLLPRRVLRDLWRSWSR